MTGRQRMVAFGYTLEDIEPEVSPTPDPVTNPTHPYFTNTIKGFFRAPSDRCEEGYHSHSGVCHPCQGDNHGGRQDHFVCEECAERTHNLIQINHPRLLKSPLLPVCDLCTTTIAWSEEPYNVPHNACSCPIINPATVQHKWKVSAGRAKWLCAVCRMEALEEIQFRVKVEDEEIRRGIVAVEWQNRIPTIAIMGRLCFCLKHLGGMGSEPLPGCAYRCASCFKYSHHGVPLALTHNNQHRIHINPNNNRAAGPSTENHNYQGGYNAQHNNRKQMNMP